MDVTSLLNSSAVSDMERADQSDRRGATPTSSRSSPCQTTKTSPGTILARRASDSKPDNRSRLPWDGNGFTMPDWASKRDAVTTSPRVSEADSTHNDGDASRSQGHKWSGSNSSVSSVADSVYSLRHSRVSSVSTLGGPIPALSKIPDIASLNISQANRDPASRPSQNPLSRLTPPRLLEGSTSPMHYKCTSSPSEGLAVSKRDWPVEERPSTQLPPMSAQHISAPWPHQAASPLDVSRAHKRASSLPDGPHIAETRKIHPLPAPRLLTNPSSYNASAAMSSTSVPVTPIESGGNSPHPTTEAQKNQEIKCLYMDNCDTNSALRKAISHIFGRNKVCTRSIPDHVWVHFCRKHYQRTRYRNSADYAGLQCELVLRQLQNVQDWSDENQRTGQDGVLTSWQLVLRKREQERVQKLQKRAGAATMGVNSRKRSVPEENPQDVDGEDNDEDVTEDDASLSSSAVPVWLRNMCGDGYTSKEIENIVVRLTTEIAATNKLQMPDIEILPNITFERPAKRHRHRESELGLSRSVERRQSRRCDISSPIQTDEGSRFSHVGGSVFERSLSRERLPVSAPRESFYEDRHSPFAAAHPGAHFTFRAHPAPYHSHMNGDHPHHPQDDYLRRRNGYLPDPPAPRYPESPAANYHAMTPRGLYERDFSRMPPMNSGHARTYSYDAQYVSEYHPAADHRRRQSTASGPWAPRQAERGYQPWEARPREAESGYPHARGRY